MAKLLQKDVTLKYTENDGSYLYMNGHKYAYLLKGDIWAWILYKEYNNYKVEQKDIIRPMTYKEMLEHFKNGMFWISPKEAQKMYDTWIQRSVDSSICDWKTSVGPLGF